MTIHDNTFGIVVRDILGRISLDGLTRPVGGCKGEGAGWVGGYEEVTMYKTPSGVGVIYNYLGTSLGIRLAIHDGGEVGGERGRVRAWRGARAEQRALLVGEGGDGDHLALGADEHFRRRDARVAGRGHRDRRHLGDCWGVVSLNNSNTAISQGLPGEAA